MAAKSLEERITALEDMEAIKKVHFTYCYLMDARKADEVAELFAPGARIDFPGVGGGGTKAEIARFYREVLPSVYPFLMHNNHNSIVEVEGNKGRGKWYLQVSATHGKTDRAMWIAGVYNNEYSKINGQWKIQSMAVTNIYGTPYDQQGWNKMQFYP